MGLRLGGLGWSVGSVGCYGVRTGGSWDHQWDQLGAMGPGLGMVNRIHWVLWGQDGGDWDHQWDQLGAMVSGLVGLGS